MHKLSHRAQSPVQPTLRAAALVSLCALLAFPAHVAAQPAPAKAEAAQGDGEAAKALFVQGQSEYDLGHFKEALSLFEQAYKKKNVAALLYNIAQCHRQMGDLKMARTTYKAFLSKQPGSPFAALAKEKLAEVEQALDAQQTARTAQPTELAPAGDSPGVPAKAEEPKNGGELTPPAPIKPAPAKEPAVTAATPATTAKEAPAPPPAPVAVKETPKPKEKEQAPAPSTRLKPGTTPPVPQEPGRTWTWVAGGAAVVALAAGVAFGMQSKSTADSIAATEHTGAQVKQLGDDVASQASKGNLLVGVGLGLAVVSATCFVLHF